MIARCARRRRSARWSPAPRGSSRPRSSSRLRSRCSRRHWRPSSHPGSILRDAWPSAVGLAPYCTSRWGFDLACSCGPLGCLRLPIACFAGTSRLALIYVGATPLGLSASLLYVLRRAFGVWVGCALTLLALCLVPDERAVAVAFIWAVVALRADAPSVVLRAFPPAVGVLAALELLVKLNSGVAVLAIGVIATLALRGRLRNLLVLAGCFISAFLALWLLAEQRVGDIPTYLFGSKEIVVGYASALGGSDKDTAGAVAAALLAVAVVFAVARRAAGGTGRRLRWAVYPLWAVAAFLLFKEGFVRSDTSHRPIFFAFALCALLALAWERAQMSRMLVAAGALALATAWRFQGAPLP